MRKNCVQLAKTYRQNLVDWCALNRVVIPRPMDAASLVGKIQVVLHGLVDRFLASFYPAKIVLNTSVIRARLHNFHSPYYYHYYFYI